MKSLLKAKLLPILITLVCLVLLLPASVFADITEQLWEYYNTGNTTAISIYLNEWSAQTFTTGTEAHSVTEIRLMMSRTGSPYTVEVAIKETSGGEPTGSDLASGTIDGDSFDTTVSWYAIPITEYRLEASTKYAIVVRNLVGDGANYVNWAIDGTAASYAGGSQYTSANGGITWSEDTDDDYMFEIRGNELIDLDTAKVFSDYLETGDMLITLAYTNEYVPYYPNDTPTRYFYLQLTSTDGATVLNQITCPAWGYRPSAIYLSANQAVALTLGTAYRVYIYADFGSNPSDFYTLTSSDWIGSDMNALDAWVLLTANSIGDNDDIILTTEVAGEEVLNETGGAIFNKGIPSLSDVRPDIFQVTITTPSYGTEAWTDAFEVETTWQDQVGSTIATSFTNLGSLFGVDGKAIGAFLLFGLYMALAITVVKRGGDIVIGALLAIPFIVYGAWLRFIDIAIIAAIGGVMVMIAIFSFWWRRT